MFGRFASETFSRAWIIAPVGKSTESKVNALPVASKVPELSVSRVNSSVAHEVAAKQQRVARRIRGARMTVRVVGSAGAVHRHGEQTVTLVFDAGPRILERMAHASAPLDEERHAEALREHARAFETSFRAGGPFRLFFAPGRVNLMGAHLDYNGGPVMPTAIDRGTFLAARPRSDQRVVFASLREAGRQSFLLDELPDERTGSWADYPLGVLRSSLARQKTSGRGAPCGVEILFGGNLPVGAGLSSSASICVGTAAALDALWELRADPLEHVESALEAERGFVGVQCGIMDPYAVGLARPGQLLWLDCKDKSWEHLPLDFSRLALAVADTGVRRELAEGAFNERVAECAQAFDRLRAHAPDAVCLRDIPPAVLEEHRSSLSAPVARRAEHVLREVERTFDARAALLDGNPAGFGAAMTAAHASLRDLFEVSCAELDRLVADATSVPGVLGSRLTGAGFGGCSVILLERGAEQELRAALDEGFLRAFGRTPRLELFHGDRGPREVSF